MNPNVVQPILQDRKVIYAVTDRDLNVSEVGGAAHPLLDYGAWPGHRLTELVPELEGSEDVLNAIIAGELPRFQLTWVNRDSGEGETIYLTMIDLPFRDGAGEITGVIHVVEDVTEMGILEQLTIQQRNELYLLRDNLIRQHRKLDDANAELWRIAMHDTLTNLPNRALFMERLELAIRRADKSENYLFAVLFLDLDRFKVINDSLGHTVGDEVLIAIARRLEECVRAKDTVARLGGDEFAILIDDIKKPKDAIIVARRIQEELARPISLDEQRVFITASTGIAFGKIKYDSPADLLRDADTAMYRAKSQGKARYEVFDISMYTQAMARWQLETDLRQAVERQEFRVYYQPLVSMADRRIAGVEALLRWEHPERGIVGPDEFIPLTEETGLIVPIGEWVLREVCARLAAWHAEGHHGLRAAVNISALQLQEGEIVELIRGLLEETGIGAETLELEITESVAIQERDLPTLHALKELGLQISLDDFGLGSSLDCLKRLPIDTLKIDQSFVKGIVEEPGNKAIITAIIAMSHSLKLRVVAEGVETETHLGFLRSEQCDEIQGDLFGKPMPPDAMTALLRQKNSDEEA